MRVIKYHLHDPCATQPLQQLHDARLREHPVDLWHTSYTALNREVITNAVAKQVLTTRPRVAVGATNILEMSSLGGGRD